MLAALDARPAYRFGEDDIAGRLDDSLVIDRLVTLGQAGMASGVDEAFDIDAFIEETRVGA